MFHFTLFSWEALQLHLKTILQESFGGFSKALLWEESWLWKLGNRNCFAEWQSHFAVSSLCKNVFLGKPLATAVWPFPVAVRYRPLYCRCMAVHVFVPWAAAGGREQWHFCKARASPSNAGGRTLHSIIFLLCLGFCPFCSMVRLYWQEQREVKTVLFILLLS